jgi:hypothetical protein
MSTGKLDAAKKCIADNLRNYVKADARSHPDNFNLYNALKSIIGAVEDMNHAVEGMKRKVKELEGDLDDANREIERLKRRP